MNYMNNYGIIRGPKFLTVIAEGKPHSITTSDARFAQAVEYVSKKQWDKFFLIMDKPAAIAKYSNGAVQVFDEEVHYKGVPIKGVIVERILEFVKQGFDFKPLCAFLENLYVNTDAGIREKLYTFLENNQLGITERGSFLAYKLVNEDGTPIYNGTGTFFDSKGNTTRTYKVGEKFTFPANRIVKSTNECSTEGLYVGNKAYWNGAFDADNNYTGSGRMLIVEIYPQHVCNVPHADCTKIVVCELNVLDEYKVSKAKANQALYADSVPVQSFDADDSIGDLFDSLDDYEIEYVVSQPSAKKKQANFHSVRDANGRFVRASRKVAKTSSGPKRDAKGRFRS